MRTRTKPEIGLGAMRTTSILFIRQCRRTQRESSVIDGADGHIPVEARRVAFCFCYAGKRELADEVERRGCSSWLVPAHAFFFFLYLLFSGRQLLRVYLCYCVTFCLMLPGGVHSRHRGLCCTSSCFFRLFFFLRYDVMLGSLFFFSLFFHKLINF